MQCPSCPRPRRALRRWAPALVIAPPLFIAACTSYERHPIDPVAHQAIFLTRTAESVAVPATASPNAPFDLSDGCSLREAESLALVMNPSLRVARAKLGVLEASAVESGRWADPTIAADVTRILDSVAEPWKLATTISFTLPISGRLEAERERAGAERDAEVLRVLAAEWETRVQVRRAWADRVASNLRRQELVEAISREDAVAAIAGRLEAAGEIGRVESRLFRIDAATKREQLLAAETASAESEIALRSLLGLPPGATIAFADRLPEPAPRTNDECRAALLAGNPSIAIARAEHEVAERALALEIRKQFPDLTIGPGYGREDGADQFLFGLSLPLPILNANRQAIAEADATRTLAATTLTSLVEERTSDLERALLRHDAALRRRTLVADEIVPLVDAQFDDARRVAELGEINTLVLLETLSRRSDARLSLIDAQRDAVATALDIDLLLGPTDAR